MINKKEFENMRKELEGFEKQREIVINKSREVIKISKKIIYAVHRADIKLAEKNLKEIKARLNELDKEVCKSPELVYNGPYKVAVQEFVEAACYLEFVKNKKIPSAKELKVSTESYIAGVCDLTGELVRKAINSAINNDYDEALIIKKFVNNLYNELMLFDFRNELRRKFDSIKYDLKKLDDVALGIKLKK
jgi:translin